MLAVMYAFYEWSVESLNTQSDTRIDYICYNHGTDSLHYAILISRTGLVISSFNLLNLATPLLSYAVRLVLLFFVLLMSLLCYIYDATFILTLGYPLFTNTYVS